MSGGGDMICGIPVPPEKDMSEYSTVQQYLWTRRAVIIECYVEGVPIKQIAARLKVIPSTFEKFLTAHNLTRKSLGLPQSGPVSAPDSLDVGDTEDLGCHDVTIRRGHYMRQAPAIVAAQCGRPALWVMARARVLGLGPWDVASDVRVHQARLEQWISAGYEGAFAQVDAA